jgi:integrase
LFKRDGRLYFRRRVPEELREIIGQREWKVSLKLREGAELEAVAPIRKLTQETDRMIRDAERQAASGQSEAEAAEAAYRWAKQNQFLKDGAGRLSEEGEFSPLDFQIDAMLQAILKRVGKRFEGDIVEADMTRDERMRLATLREGERVEVPCTVSMALEHYRKHHKSGVVPKAEETAVEQFIELVGDERLEEIRRKDVRDWIARLSQERGQGWATIRRRLSSLSAIFNRSNEDLELNLQNPFANQKLPESSSGKTTDRLPFHSSHLKLIADHLEHSRIKRETAVLLRLLRGTTCGSAEIAGVEWEDVILDAEVPHLKIRPNGLRGLKSQSRPRDFPLVGDALEAIKAWKPEVQKPVGPVFSNRARDGNALSQRLIKVIRRAGVPKSKRLVVYSFRHTFEEAMRVGGVDADLQRYLMGHGEGSMTDRYGAPKPSMKRLQAAVETALKHLGEVDKSNYRAEELPAPSGG